MKTNQKKYVTVADFAEILKCSKTKIFRLIKSNEILNSNIIKVTARGGFKICILKNAVDEFLKNLNPDFKEFKKIEGYEHYFINKNGEVWSTKTNRFLKAGQTNFLYSFVNLSKDKIFKSVLVHRLVAQTFLKDSWFEGAEVDHIDGDVLNNSVENLRWVTHEENTLNRCSNNYNTKPIEMSKNIKQIPFFKNYYINKDGEIFKKDRNNLLHKVQTLKQQNGNEWVYFYNKKKIYTRSVNKLVDQIFN